MQARIVSYDHKTMDLCWGLLDKADNCIRRRIVELFNRYHLDGRTERERSKFPGFLGAGGRGYQHPVGDQRIGRQVGPDSGRILAPALDQYARAVFRARLRLRCLCMTKQQKTAHVLLANHSMNSGLLGTIAGDAIGANAARSATRRNSLPCTIPRRLDYIHNDSSISGLWEHRAQFRLQFSYVEFCWNIQ